MGAATDSASRGVKPARSRCLSQSEHEGDAETCCSGLVTMAKDWASFSKLHQLASFFAAESRIVAKSASVALM